MWHDVEAKVDLLNFSLVAQTAAQLIRDSAGEPLTIGISGGWGVGKSSLVKMIGEQLQISEKNRIQREKKFVFLEFNAWLYQGFDDARHALLQAVSDTMIDVAKERETYLDKALAFGKRVKLLKLGRMVAPMLTHAVMGTAIGGPLGALVGAAGGLVQGLSDATSREENLKQLQEAYAGLQPELKGLLGEKHEESLPKEIQGLRNSFEGLLKELDITLVVLVDDLDRCLPQTAISTLEAMRLLLHVRHTAFIIAADEGMIRGAVRAHFQGVDINDDLVTSYFDKLIQVPLRVPRLGVNEVKAYVILLLADLATRKGRLTAETFSDAQTKILNALKNAWAGGLTHDVLKATFGADASKVASEIEIAEQLAPILVTAEQINGNPRLIKRFLNNLMIRQTVAKAQGMTFSFDVFVKLQLFERCASSPAFDLLAQAIAGNDEGHAIFLEPLEAAAAKGESYAHHDPAWGGAFYEQWIKLNPPLTKVNLKPLLYLSRDRALALASYDELSPQARKVFEATLQADSQLDTLVAQVKDLGEAEAGRVLTRLLRKARSDQWSSGAVTRCFNCTKAYPVLGNEFAAALTEIPAQQRMASILPLLSSQSWAETLLVQWADDTSSPLPVKNYLKRKTNK